ncbi:MAG: hypothetical protein ACT452_03820 [Microthrixaceae bacterium]
MATTPLIRPTFYVDERLAKAFELDRDRRGHVCTNDLLEIVARLGSRRFPERFDRQYRECTKRFLKSVALSAEEAFDSHEAKAMGRAAWVAREAVPFDYAEVAGAALDLGYTQTPVPAGAFVDACNVVRERLIGLAEVIAEGIFEAISRGRLPESVTYWSS